MPWTWRDSRLGCCSLRIGSRSRLLQFCEPILANKYWILRNQTQSSGSHERKLCWKNDHRTCEAVAIPRKKSGLQRGASQPHSFMASKLTGQGASQRSWVWFPLKLDFFSGHTGNCLSCFTTAMIVIIAVFHVSRFQNVIYLIIFSEKSGLTSQTYCRAMQLRGGLVWLHSRKKQLSLAASFRTNSKWRNWADIWSFYVLFKR